MNIPTRRARPNVLYSVTNTAISPAKLREDLNNSHGPISFDFLMGVLGPIQHRVPLDSSRICLHLLIREGDYASSDYRVGDRGDMEGAV